MDYSNSLHHSEIGKMIVSQKRVLR